MTREREIKIIRGALEARYSAATDNAARARAMSRGMHSGAEAALFREYFRAEEDALAELKSFDPNWAPRRAFSR